MNELAFVLHLGGGLYMDSNGDLHQGPPPNVPIYQAPFQLPVDPNKVKEAFSAVKAALKDVNKYSSNEFILNRWGKVTELLTILDILDAVGKVAAVIAPLAGVLSFAVDAAKMFGLIKEGPSSLELLMVARFDVLEKE